MTKIVKNKQYDETTIKNLFPDLKLLFEIGKGDWKDSLFYVPSEDIYLEKGPLGPHDSICFILSQVSNQDEALSWKSKVEEYWKKYFPNSL